MIIKDGYRSGIIDVRYILRGRESIYSDLFLIWDNEVLLVGFWSSYSIQTAQFVYFDVTLSSDTSIIITGSAEYNNLFMYSIVIQRAGDAGHQCSKF